MKGRIHALTYHDVVRTDGATSGMTGVGRGHYRLTWERFLEHLDRIEHVAAAPPAILDDWMAADGGHDAWCLTFDDGGASALDVGEELHRADGAPTSSLRQV